MSKQRFSLTIDYLNDSIERDVRAVVGFVSLNIRVVSYENMEDFFKNTEKNNKGVYILLGENIGENIKKQKIYIGETNTLKGRLKKHYNDKDWLQKAVLIHKEGHFNSAHYRYLEAMLIKEAKKNVSYDLVNTQVPEVEDLSFTDVAECEQLLSYIYCVLPALRIDIFFQKSDQEQKIQDISPSEEQIIKEEIEEPVFVFKTKKKNLMARMVIRDDKYVILKGSRAVFQEKKAYSDVLIQKGILVKEGEYYIFTENAEFSSPSAAAFIIAGRASNGRAEWILENTQIALKEWQEQRKTFNLQAGLQEQIAENIKEDETLKIRLDNEDEDKEKSQSSYQDLIFIISLAKYGLMARMRVEDQKSFIILAGSQTLGYWRGVARDAERMNLIYRSLKEEKIIQKDGDNYIFIKDYKCGSSSLAGGIVTGSTRGGWLNWKEEKTGALLQEWCEAIEKNS